MRQSERPFIGIIPDSCIGDTPNVYVGQQDEIPWRIAFGQRYAHLSKLLGACEDAVSAFAFCGDHPSNITSAKKSALYREQAQFLHWMLSVVGPHTSSNIRYVQVTNRQTLKTLGRWDVLFISDALARSNEEREGMVYIDYFAMSQVDEFEQRERALDYCNLVRAGVPWRPVDVMIQTGRSVYEDLVGVLSGYQTKDTRHIAVPTPFLELQPEELLETINSATVSADAA